MGTTVKVEGQTAVILNTKGSYAHVKFTRTSRVALVRLTGEAGA